MSQVQIRKIRGDQSARRGRLRGKGIDAFKCFALLCALAVGPVFAQDLEMGLTGGGGYFGDYGVKSSGAQFGVELCGFCSRRFALFTEYTHWLSGNATRGGEWIQFQGRNGVNLIGGGLRIQGRGHVRPFVDMGVAGGNDQHGDLGAFVAAGGVTLPVGAKWYVRPQIRFYASVHTAVVPSLGVGYRF